MTRRSSPQSRIDDVAFPVRVKVQVPPRGLGTRLNELHQWLRDHLGAGEYAVHPAESIGSKAAAFYFRQVCDAGAFAVQNPDLVLADGTLSQAYSGRTGSEQGRDLGMCNLYAMTRNQDEMNRLFAPLGATDRLGDLAPLDQIYPDYKAPILRNREEGRELVLGRWGMPTPPQFLKGKKTDRGVTNIRNTKSPHWRRWLGPEHRCLVPFTRFAEPHHREKHNVWFGFEDDRPAFLPASGNGGPLSEN